MGTQRTHKWMQLAISIMAPLLLAGARTVATAQTQIAVMQSQIVDLRTEIKELRLLLERLGHNP